MVHIAKPAPRFGRSLETARPAALLETGSKLIYQRVQGEQVVPRSATAGNLLNRDEFIVARAPSSLCARANTDSDR